MNMLSTLLLALLSAGLTFDSDWQPMAPQASPQSLEFARDALSQLKALSPDGTSAEARMQGLETTGRALIDTYGRESTIYQLHEVLIAGANDAAIAEEFRTAFALLDYAIHPTVQETFRSIAPFWPLASEGPQSTFLRNRLIHSLKREKPNEHISSFKSVGEILSAAWEKGDHQYDGIIDFLYEMNAALAYSEITNWTNPDDENPNAEDLESDAEPIMIPYHDYYRNHPEELPEGTIPKAKAQLLSYARSDSLWARVFVAEVIKTVPYLRDPAIEEALRADPHWLIQRRMKYLDEAEAESEPPAPAE